MPQHKPPVDKVILVDNTMSMYSTTMFSEFISFTPNKIQRQLPVLGCYPSETDIYSCYLRMTHMYTLNAEDFIKKNHQPGKTQV